MAAQRIAIAPDDDFNRRLVAEVHPADWRNPEPGGRYNLVAIGAGTAGLVAAAGTAGLGGKAALIERHLMGGDCLNVGCVPSKALIRCARAAADARAASAYGVSVGQVSVDFPAVMARMRRLRAHIAPHDSAARFRDLGVDVYLGHARFVSDREVEVAGVTLPFSRAVIATGARAFVPPIDGLAEAGYLTNDTVFELTALPRRLVVIGGGAIGCELAQCFARLGAQVTIVEALPRVLIKEEPDAADIVAAGLRRDGVRILTGARVDRVEPGPAATAGAGPDGDAGADADTAAARCTVIVQGDGGATRLPADAILVAAGRRANVDDLGLDAAGVQIRDRLIAVDDRMRTTNKRVYAAGDCASVHQFTHAADAMARLVLRNALFFGRGKVSGLVVPRVTFTDPELAAVGLTAAEADDRKIAVDTFEQPLSGVDRAVVDWAWDWAWPGDSPGDSPGGGRDGADDDGRDGAHRGGPEGFLRVHLRRGKDQIVGATFVGPHAGELIGEVATVMAAGLGLGAIGAAIHPYPTLGLGLRQLADQRARTRLTPLVARIFRWILARRR